MTKYIDAEKLIAEIEQLKGQLIRGACAAQIEMETNCKDEAYNEVLHLLDSLQQEQPSLPSNLDEAANKFAVSYDQGTCDGIAQECFKAGAQWMENQFEHCGTFPIEDPNGGYWPTDYYIKKK